MCRVEVLRCEVRGDALPCLRDEYAVRGGVVGRAEREGLSTRESSALTSVPDGTRFPTISDGLPAALIAAVDMSALLELLGGQA